MSSFDFIAPSIRPLDLSEVRPGQTVRITSAGDSPIPHRSTFVVTVGAVRGTWIQGGPGQLISTDHAVNIELLRDVPRDDLGERLQQVFEETWDRMEKDIHLDRPIEDVCWQAVADEARKVLSA